MMAALVLTLRSSQGFVTPTYCRSSQPTAQVATRALRSSVIVSEVHWMDHLKFGGSAPTFDVLEQTKEYVAASEAAGGLATDYHANDYMFRGSIVGPITGKDVAETQADFNLLGAYPDIDRGIFGYTLDPQNPYRCFFFERWTGTCTGSIQVGALITLPPTGKRIETPIHVSSIVWNPEGKVVYESISPPVDRFEGNTKGSGAVFGLLSGAGLALPGEIGSPFLMFGQRFNTDLLGGLFGKTWSSEENIASWWKSKAKGADPTDM